MSNRVYIASFNTTLTPATPVLDSIFRIESPGREIKIKSITVTWRMYDTTTLQILPWRVETTQSFILRVNPLQQDIGYAFTHTGGTVPQRIINITEPASYHFDGFFIANELRLELSIFNHPATNNVIHMLSVIVETEEQTMFNQ